MGNADLTPDQRRRVVKLLKAASEALAARQMKRATRLLAKANVIRRGETAEVTAR
jgi:hypothetical protein